MIKNYHNKSWLEKKYLTDKMSSVQISKLEGVGHCIILRWLHRFGIPVRTLNESHPEKFNFSKEFLLNEYWDNNKSFSEIANDIGCSISTVQNRFNQYDLPRRPAKCPIGEKNGNWKGGKNEDKDGYVHIMQSNHPRKKRYIPEHILVMERKLNRYLDKIERVHHNDGNKHNNEISNLKLFPTSSAHQIYESNVKLFCKQLLWGKIQTSNRNQLLDLFDNFIKEHR